MRPLYARNTVTEQLMRSRLNLYGPLCALLLLCHARAETISLSGPSVRAILIVDDPTPGPSLGRTYLAELYFLTEHNATANLLWNYTQVRHDPSPWSAARLSSTAAAWSAAPGAGPFCGSVGGASPPTRSLQLSCDAGGTLEVLFAAYGTPDLRGGCEAPAQGACAAPDATAAVAAACTGLSSCVVWQGAPSFPGADPCPDTVKSLYVRANCTAGATGRVLPPLTSWSGGSGGVAADVSTSRAVVEGVALGGLALETWTIDVSAGLKWDVARAYTASTLLSCERGPALVFNTQVRGFYGGGSSETHTS